MKIKKIGPIGGGPNFYYVDLPLEINVYKRMCQLKYEPSYLDLNHIEKNSIRRKLKAKRCRFLQRMCSNCIDGLVDWYGTPSVNFVPFEKPPISKVAPWGARRASPYSIVWTQIPNLPFLVSWIFGKFKQTTTIFKSRWNKASAHGAVAHPGNPHYCFSISWVLRN